MVKIDIEPQFYYNNDYLTYDDIQLLCTKINKDYNLSVNSFKIKVSSISFYKLNQLLCNTVLPREIKFNMSAGLAIITEERGVIDNFISVKCKNKEFRTFFKKGSKSETVSSNKCTCDIMLIMQVGCKCGGV